MMAMRYAKFLLQTPIRLALNDKRYSILKIRHFSTRDDDAKPIKIYEGPVSTAVRMLKRVSMSTTFLTVVVLPFSVFLGNDAMPPVSKIALTAIISFFGLSTTGLLHWVAKGYVINLAVHPEDAHLLGLPEKHTPEDEDDLSFSLKKPTELQVTSNDTVPIPAVSTLNKIEVPDLSNVRLIAKTMNILGRPIVSQFKQGDVNPNVNGVFVSFRVGERPFFLQNEIVRSNWRLSLLFPHLV